MASSSFLLAIPTRNRTNTLLKSLDALVGADRYPHLKVVVSDNSDEVDTVAKDFCERHGFSYVRPPKVLPMAAHWDWILREFPFETVAIATDRSYFNLPRLMELEQLVRVTGKVVSYDSALYTEKRPLGVPLWMISARPMTGCTFEIPCAALIDRLTTNFFEPSLPRLMTCIVHADHLNAVRRRFPDTLSSFAPDFEFGYKFLFTFAEDSLLFAEQAMFMSHSKSESTGLSYGAVQSRSAVDFHRLNNLTAYSHSPLPDHLTSHSLMAHELNKIASELGRAPIIDAANLLEQEKIGAPVKPRPWLSRRIYNLRYIFGTLDDFHVQVGVGSLYRDLDRSFSRLRYDAQAATLFSHPGIRRVDEQSLLRAGRAGGSPPAPQPAPRKQASG